jgi:tetratricopeptide (TPR) repeat protein
MIRRDQFIRFETILVAIGLFVSLGEPFVAGSDDWESHYKDGRKAVEEGRWLDAIEELEQAAKDEQAQKSNWTKRDGAFLENRFFPFFYLAQAYFNVGRYNEAKEMIQKELDRGKIVEELSSDAAKLLRDAEFETTLNRAHASLLAKRYNEALYDLNRLPEIDPVEYDKRNLKLLKDGAYKNTLVLQNDARTSIVVKLNGPLKEIVEIADSQKKVLRVPAGEYTVLSRFGNSPAEYIYSKRGPLAVTETAAKHSEITIKLRKPSRNERVAEFEHTGVGQEGLSSEGKVKKGRGQAREQAPGRPVASLREIVDVKEPVDQQIARTATELSELRKMDQRRFFELDLPLDTVQRVADIELRLRKADPKRQKYNILIRADKNALEKKEQSANRSVQFLVGPERTDYDLVINSVDKDRVRGYLSTPKGKLLTVEQRLDPGTGQGVSEGVSCRISFENPSDLSALIRIIGPSARTVDVQKGQSRIVDVAGGEYSLLVRYGENGEYIYSKAGPLQITETVTVRSVVKITLPRSPKNDPLAYQKWSSVSVNLDK